METQSHNPYLKIIKAKNENATELDLNNCGINKIPLGLFELIRLKVLVLNNNEISDLSGLKILKNLEYLDISHNKISSLDALEGISSLEYLNASHNSIETIDPIKKLDKLRYLHLGNNIISSVSPIRNLRRIEYLNLWGNQIHDISALKYLENLIELDLHSNLIRELSPIGNLKSLTNLNVKMNVVLDTPPEILNQGVFAVKTYHNEIKNSETTEVFEAKLLIVGEAGAGKTTLQRKLIDKNSPLPNLEDSTRGIDIQSMSFSVDSENYLKLNLWDFGGQEIYTSTHQFFLTKRSLYLLVANNRRKDTVFEEWLDIIKVFGDESPLLIIHNEIAARPPEAINFSGHQERYGSFLKAQFKTNLKSGKGLKEIVDSIEFHVKKLPHVGTLMPKGWVSIRKELEKLAKVNSIIPVEKFYSICNDFDISDQQSANILSQYFHDIGVLLHFQDDELLERIVILQNEWATKAVYKVLEDSIVQSNLGFVKKEDLKRIWNYKSWRKHRPELIHLMNKFELCYELKNNKNYHYLIPQLCPAEPPIYNWNKKQNKVVRYEYDFLPRGLITRLAVRLHTYIKKVPKKGSSNSDDKIYEDLVWKEGMVLWREGAEAEIKKVYSKKESKKESLKKSLILRPSNTPAIEIRVFGSKAKEFLTILTEEVDKLNDSLGKLEVQKLIRCNCNECYESEMPYYYYYAQLEERILRKQKTIECYKSFKNVDVVGLLNNTFKNSTNDLVMEIKELFSKREFEKGIEMAKSVFNQSEAYNDIIVLETQYRKLLKREMVHGDEISLEENKFLSRILDFLDILLK